MAAPRKKSNSTKKGKKIRWQPVAAVHSGKDPGGHLLHFPRLPPQPVCASCGVLKRTHFPIP